MEVNDIENRKTIEKTKKPKSWFFKKINISGRPLARVTRKKGEETQIKVGHYYSFYQNKKHYIYVKRIL